MGNVILQMMNKIGIVVAMDSEFTLVEALLEDRVEKKIDGFVFVEGRVGTKSVVLSKSGIGKVCASVGIVEMVKNFGPDCIINTGVAGGIDKKINVMDVVVGETMVYHDVWCGEGNEYGQVQGLPARFEADRKMYDTAMAIKEKDVAIYGGLICSGDKFITDVTELNSIKGHFPEGLAVDMETCAMAQVCYLYQVPFLSFRIISDTPGFVENHSEQFQNFWVDAPGKSFEVLKQLVTQI